ncbi:BrnA antitoxin family protein [Treponema sp.]
MKEKTSYQNAPEEIAEGLTVGERINDFLPPPDKLVRRLPKVKVTITLNSRSVDFFKRSAKKNKVKYQTMINEILDQYAQKYADYE